MKVAAFLAPLLLLSACAPVYTPNSVNTPLLQERGEVQVGGRVSPGSGGELQVAAALTDHVALMANGSAFWSSGEHREDKTFREHFLGEVGLGYFDRTKEWVGRDLQYEVFGGYGWGRGEAASQSSLLLFILPFPDQRYARGRYRRFFAQVDAGLPLLERLDLVAALRGSLVQFDAYEAHGSALGEDDRPHVFFLEPAVGWQGGLPQVQVMTQTGVSFAPWAHKVEFERSAVFLSVGLRIRFDVLRGGFFRE